MDRIADTEQGTGPAEHTGSSFTFEFMAYQPVDPSQPKRPPGRPKGSKSTPGPSNPAPPVVSEQPKKRRGRPRGQGPRQLEAQQLELEEQQAEIQRRARETSQAIHDAAESSQPEPPLTPAESSQPTAHLQPQPFSGLSTDSIQSIVLPEDDDLENGVDAGLAHEGLGEEDDEVGDEDLPDPEFQEAPNATGKRVPRRMPKWLEEEFTKCVEQSKSRKQDGLPQLYHEHHTFFFPRQSNFFKLRAVRNCPPSALYNYEFFLWDPEPLVHGGIACPTCHTRLHRHDHISRPRRVVDFDRTIWMIGYRYKCPSCLHPVSRKKTVTFTSWDSRILTNLPRALAIEFPARLSARSGISKSLFSFMRTCFQHGMGSKQFSNALRVQHLQNYDEIHLQYLHYISTQLGISSWRGETFKAFLPFEDSSPQGFRGYVPSSQWLRNMYDKFIEGHYIDFNQHTAMLSAEICAIDHSFKITKQIAKINGVQVFVGLLTVTNEKGEIRVCNLVASKSHSQFEVSLAQMLTSLRMYGHTEPAIFYTDNMADKEFLERAFPSLKKDVVAVEKHSHLPAMTIPSDVFVCQPLKSVSEINEAMRSIIQLLPDEGTGQYLVIGLDTEYNIACEKKVYILQVGQMISGKSLPDILIKVLANPRILKVGSRVTADLVYLQECCGSPTAFKGGINLGAFAKERMVVKTARASLEDLCAVVLSRCLSKNVAERVGSHWEDADLTAEQIKYAALDAFTSLAIYEALLSIPLPSPLPSEITAHTPVLLFSGDQARLVARGRISTHHNSPEYDSISITPKRCVLEILECYVPGSVISTHNKRSLDSFGPTPFHVVCLRSHVRMAESVPIAYSTSVIQEPARPVPNSAEN
ncbi:hypothetical protein C8J56DRAFT_827736, partial [Mycena floridula]